MIRRPPRSTLFPTRRSSDLYKRDKEYWLSKVDSFPNSPTLPLKTSVSEELGKRSEEHTSELQSRQYLVCRLLLEKKLDLRADITRSTQDTHSTHSRHYLVLH